MSAGEIVSIPDNGIGWIPYTGTEITAQFTYFQGFADEQRDALTRSIEDLNDLIETFDPDYSDVDVTVPTIDGPSFPGVPSFGELELDEYPDNDLASPIFMPYPDMDFSYITPQIPDDISPTWNFALGDYSSDMWSALFNKVHGDILNGGTGLTDAVHAAIVAREQEARRINQNREYTAGLNAVGSTGFNLPSGQVAAFQVEIQREMIQKDQDSLNSITIKDFDLATDNTKFAVTTGKELEQFLRSTWEVVQKVGFEAEKAANQYVIYVYEANIKKYLAAWEGVKIDLEALKTQIDAIVAYNEGLVKVWLGQIEAYTSEIKAVVAHNEGLVSVRQTEVSIYETEVKAVAVQYDALVKEAGLQIDAARLEIEQALGNLKVQLTAYNDQATLAEQIAESKAKIAAQSIASALGAINTSMSQGYDSSERLSESWSHGEKLNESHSL